MSRLQIQRHQYLKAATSRGSVLLHIPTTTVFGIDPVTGALLDLFESRDRLSADEVHTTLDGRFAAAEVFDSLQELRTLGVLADREQDHAIPVRTLERSRPSTLVLTLTTGCNLCCTYCYRDDLERPRDARVMDGSTGRKAIDLLIEQANAEEPLVVTFFGGEPLTCFPLIRELTVYAEERARALSQRIRFSITTNASLLTEEIIRFFDEHRFGIAVSIDGDQTQHNRHRLTPEGKGTYQRVAERVAKLLSGYKARPVGARVTLGHGNTDVEGIYAHLHDRLGFHEVGFAPVTAAPGSPFGLTDDEMAEVFAGMRALGRAYTTAAKRGERHGFSNMNQLMRDLWQGTRKILPCGAGIGLLAVGANGAISLCHRFTGSGFTDFGNLDDGIATLELHRFLTEAQQRHPACRQCPARAICAGGCYHESYTRSGDPRAPVFDLCEYIRDWLAFGLECYGEIILTRPNFFAAPTKTLETLQ